MQTTPNYELPLYEGTDKPNLRDGYNEAMGLIDTELKDQAGNIVNANATATTALSKATEASTAASDAATAAGNAQGTANQAQTAATAAQTELTELKADLGTSAYLDTTSTIEAGNANPATSEGVQAYVAQQIADLPTPTPGDGGNKLICIGDSWTNPDDSWADHLGKWTGWDIEKFASNGAGWTVSGAGGKTISDLVDEFIATNEANENVKAIIIFAGINDILNSANQQTIINTAVSVINNLNSTYSGKIYVGVNADTTNQLACHALQDAMNLSMKGNVSMRLNSTAWLNWWANGMNLYKDDNLHPNSTGQYVLANRMLTVLKGAPQPWVKISIPITNYGRYEVRSNGEYFILDPSGLTGTFAASTAGDIGSVYSDTNIVQQFPFRNVHMVGHNSSGIASIVFMKSQNRVVYYPPTANTNLAQTIALCPVYMTNLEA